MKYLYGDGSPFPINGNFIDTLMAVTDCCVALVMLDSEVASALSAEEKAEAVANRSLTVVETLSQAVGSALAPCLGTEGQGPIQRAVADIHNAVGQALDRARKEIASERARSISAASADRIAPRVDAVLGKFFRMHELPDTKWQLLWIARADGSAEADVCQTAGMGLQTIMRVAIPGDHLWARPVGVQRLARGLYFELPSEKRGWLRRSSHTYRELLDKLVITRVEASEGRKVVLLSRRSRELEPALELVVQAGDGSQPTLTRLDGKSRKALAVTGHNRDTAKALWTRVNDTLKSLLSHRNEYVCGSMRNSPLSDIARPRDIAKVLIDSVSPIVREMRKRGPSPGEISLKRDLSDGRREELFVPRDQIVRKFSGVPDDYRSLFSAFGVDASSDSSKAPKKRTRVTRGPDASTNARIGYGSGEYETTRVRQNSAPVGAPLGFPEDDEGAGLHNAASESALSKVLQRGGGNEDRTPPPEPSASLPRRERGA